MTPTGSANAKMAIAGIVLVLLMITASFYVVRQYRIDRSSQSVQPSAPAVAVENTNADAAAGSSASNFNDGQIGYPINDKLFSVEKKPIRVLDLVSPSALVAQSAECGTNLSESYFTDLLSKYRSDSTGSQYSFIYKGESQGGVYTVTVLPNLLGYTDAVKFNTDFGQCFAGGDLYPYEVSNNYLLFVNSVSTGFDDGSGLPHGGEKIQEFLGSSLRLSEPGMIIRE
jgi:hypothetical protein